MGYLYFFLICRQVGLCHSSSGEYFWYVVVKKPCLYITFCAECDVWCHVIFLVCVTKWWNNEHINIIISQMPFVFPRKIVICSLLIFKYFCQSSHSHCFDGSCDEWSFGYNLADKGVVWCWNRPSPFPGQMALELVVTATRPTDQLQFGFVAVNCFCFCLLCCNLDLSVP